MMYWFTGLFGLAMAVAPFAQGYQDHLSALWASIVLGVVVFAVSVIEAMDLKHAKWEWWVAGSAGILAALTPTVFGFAIVTAERWTLLLLGVIIVILANYELFFVEQPLTTPIHDRSHPQP